MIIEARTRTRMRNKAVVMDKLQNFDLVWYSKISRLGSEYEAKSPSSDLRNA